MRVLVTGGAGQLGRSVVRRGNQHSVVALDGEVLDVRNESDIDRALDEHAPELVINAAAYTAVDGAETEHERAFAINATGAELVARGCAARGVRLLHVSTDYVFDGTSTRPYREDDAVAPLNVYGASKAAGERAVIEHGGVVVRTSWLFATGGPSFVQTIMRLAAERTELRVVDDQLGCPTWAEDLADALLVLGLRDRLDPIYHYCGDGPTSWYAYASAIVEEARRLRPLRCERIDAIPSAEYPTPARRPARSLLDTSRIRALGIVPPSWREGMVTVIREEST